MDIIVKNYGEEAACVQRRLHHSLFTIHYSRLLKLVGKGGGKEKGERRI